MPFFLTPEQKQSTFWLALWLAVALLLYTLGPILSPFIAAAILACMLNGAVDRLANARMEKRGLPGAVPYLGFVLTPHLRHLKAHYLRSSFYNAGNIEHANESDRESALDPFRMNPTP